MAVRKAMLILMCLFCSALAQSDVDANIIYDLLSKVSDGQEMTIDDLSPQTMIDDAGVVLESLDDDLDDDLDDAINLELTNIELMGGCTNRVCKYCTSYGIKFCLEARFMKLGFFLSVTANRRLIFNKEISVTNPPRVCKRVPYFGRVCVRIYAVNLKQRSACVVVQFMVRIGAFKKYVSLKIACFRIGKREETSPLISTRLLQELVDEKLNSVE